MKNGKPNQKKPIRTIAVTGGKGGVGRTNVAANLAVALSLIGRKILLFDADLGLNNIDVLFGLVSKYHIGHILSGEKSLSEIIVEGPPGVWILSSGSGIEELTNLNEFQKIQLIDEFERSDIDMDYLLIDTSAGVSSNVAFFCVAAQKNIIVISPEAASFVDAYALITILSKKYYEREFNVLINNAKDTDEAHKVFGKLSMMTEFLDISLEYFGFVPADENIPRALKRRNAVVSAFPDSPSSKNFMEIARKIDGNTDTRVKGGIQFFFGNLIRMNNDVGV